MAVFAGVGLLEAAIKEVGDVRVFLRLGQAELLLARGTDDGAEDVVERLRSEDVGRGIFGVVLREGDVVDGGLHAARKAIEVRLEESERKLARTVGAEVEEEDDVAVAHALLVGVREDEGRHEFVRDVARIFLADGIGGRSHTALPLPHDDGIPGELGAVPTPVAVHAEVATDDGGDARAGRPQAFRALGQKIRAAGGRGIASIGEGVDHDVMHAGLVSRFRQRDEMRVVAVHTAIGKEAEEVEPFSARFFESGAEDFVAGEFAVGDRFVNPGEVLIDDAPGAEIEVADL